MNDLTTIARDTPITTAGDTSTLWIAERTGKRHDNVMQDVRTLCAELDLPAGDLLKFQGIYLDSRNRAQTCYLLPFDIAHVLLIRYSASLGMVIVKEWKDLHTGKMQPKGEAHVNSTALRLIAGTKEEQLQRYQEDRAMAHSYADPAARRLALSFAGKP